MRKTFGYIAATATILMADVALSAEPPLAPGTISVEPATFEPDLGPSMPAFIQAVGNALASREFTLLAEAGHARFVADLSLSRAEAGTTTTKVPVAPVSIMPGGSPASAGGSVSFSLPTAKSKMVPLQQTRLEIRIKRRGDDTVLWHGTAITVRAANTREGQDSAVALALSEAIFRGYPAQPENIISVP